jgi:hypothetical protein
LLQNKAEINEPDTDTGDTPLIQDTPVMTAVKHRNESALSKLFAKFTGTSEELTAYLNQPNAKGETAWTIALQYSPDKGTSLMVQHMLAEINLGH